jgi:hypothetical protein
MEASMDHSSGRVSRLRRVLPVGLVGIGACAVAAYVSAMFASSPANLVSRPVASDDQSLTTSEPVPALAPTQARVAAPVDAVTGVAKAQPVTHGALP